MSEAPTEEPIAKAGRPAAKRWTTKAGRTITKLHGSVFGGCRREQVEALMGKEPEPTPAFLRPVFDAGNASEEATKQWLRAQGVKVKDKPDMPKAHSEGRFDEQIELVKFFNDRNGDAVMLALHLDGVLMNPVLVPPELFIADSPLPDTELALWESKAVAPEKFEAFRNGGVVALSPGRYVGQASAAIVLGREHLAKKSNAQPRLPLLFSVEKRVYDAATKTYSLTGERLFQLLREPLWDAATIEARCLSIVHDYLDGILPDCDGELCSCGRQRREAVAVEHHEELHRLLRLFNEAQCQVSYHEDLMKQHRAAAHPIVASLGGLVACNGFIAEARTDKRGREYFSVKKEVE